MAGAFKMALLKSIMRSIHLNKNLQKVVGQIPSLHFVWSKSYSQDRSPGFPNLVDFPVELIRNFSIIAHVDHGKSTLADRILELTGAVTKGSEKRNQMLDMLQVERERGITVKAQTASLFYSYKGKDYLLNLIDTPGHVDFSYEVSRSLSACQGCILLVDANQGVQAQTVANFYLAFTNELMIMPVLNKIDLKNASPDLVAEQMLNAFDISPDDILKVSAKFGTGVEELIHAVIDRIPSPAKVCSSLKPLRALLFDSWYDRFRGVVCLVIVIDGVLNVGDTVVSAHSGKSYGVRSVGILKPQETPVPCLYTGQVGYFTANIKTPAEAQVGDTFYHKGETVTPLPGFRQAKPMVFAGVYPVDQSELPMLDAAIRRLALNDSSVSVSKESSMALGQGFRLGFLGLLHMDVFNQRLEQEHGTQVINTTPSVPYKVKLQGKKAVRANRGEELSVNNPSQWPEQSVIAESFEPVVNGTIITPETYSRGIISLCQERRGVQLDVQNLDHSRVIIQYKLPLSEIVVDFYDKLKSLSSGYATFDYDDVYYESAPLVKLSILLNGKELEEMATIVHHNRAETIGRQMCEKLRDTIPRHLFQIAIQAAIGSHIVARENIRALKKDVVAKLYGGDVTRKMKLLRNQAEGKKRMRKFGKIELPRDTFISILQR